MGRPAVRKLRYAIALLVTSALLAIGAPALADATVVVQLKDAAGHAADGTVTLTPQAGGRRARLSRDRRQVPHRERPRRSIPRHGRSRAGRRPAADDRDDPAERHRDAGRSHRALTRLALLTAR